MFEIVFLGTSASAPSIYRGLPSAAVLAGEDRFLVDCGEGTQRQILRSGIGFKRLNHILITHQHLDHILGLGGLVSTFTRWETLEDVHIYGSGAALDRVHRLLFDVVLVGQPPDVPVYLHEVEPGEFYRGKNFSVSAFHITHRGPGCLGYIFKQDAHRPFDAEKAAELGIPAGPERAQLVRGEAVTLADGREIAPDMVLGETLPGVTLVFTGDTARTDHLFDVVQDADVLVTEATFLAGDTDTADSYGHITASQAATLARDANVRDLLLTHVSRRYREGDIIEEARSIFPRAHVARDLDHFITRRNQGIEKVKVNTRK
jgi:ribonuclease Z